MFREWVSRSLRRRLLFSLLLGVGLSLAAFQLVVDQLVDRNIVSSFDASASAVEQRERLLHEVDVILLAGLVTVLALSALITVVSVRRGLKPLAAATAAARALSPEHPAHSLPLAGLPAEIRPLGERINELLEGLADSLERERRFSTDLAHELRTPLAEIRALAEVGADERHAAPELRRFLQQIGAAAVSMQGVIESLLAVARADRQAVRNALEPLQVAPAVQARIERLRATGAVDAGRIAVQVAAGAWIQSDPRLFDALLLNLLTNALQHGDPRAPIEVDWLDRSAGCTLQVRNLAPHLSPEDLPHLTERFWRRAARDQPAASAGLGLGLWVVAGLCRVLDLRLSFDLDAGQRLSVCVSGFRSV
ncbi:MAG TPA: HAMP domain-containing sensor histidine kinase [Steroidobacteraceae bacterium]|nr:HAMP domain-containing sensor histidine kinase [Steroidobacteraceae bacterium]